MRICDWSSAVCSSDLEALLSFGRKLTGKLSFQLIAGAEHSTLAQSGANGLERSFFRPKGSLTLAWTPAAGLDLSLKVQRQGEQLDFYAFLASSEWRRVGKEWVSPCRSRWSPYH